MALRTALALLVVLLTGLVSRPLPAESAEPAAPLHQQIDQIIEAASLGAVAEVATDGEFLRRVYLDLTGSIPPSDVARGFLDDAAPDKRARVVDRLLSSPQHIRHLTNVIDVMLMERRAEKNVKNDEWRKYLYDSVAANKPWNQLAKEILGADGSDEKIRFATAFYFAREGEPNLLTRDVGRMFFGMDLQCAQCHDHPLIDSYYQSDYYGIYAFLSRGFLFTAKDKKVFYAEKAEGHVSFTSVFTAEQDKTFPRLPGAFEVDEPFFPMGEEYSVAPAKLVRPIPKYSRRAKLAELVGEGTNRQFNRNIANRLWAHMMGRGLVEPVDLHNADNPPSHPELLELLADQFAAMKYDIKGFLRELALSNTYQRSLALPASLPEVATKLEPQLPAWKAQTTVLAEAVKKADEAVLKLTEQIAVVDSEADPIYDELTKANAAIGEARKKSDAAAKALADAKKQLTAKQAIATPLSEASASADQAAKLLPDEKELLALAQKLKARTGKIAAEVAAANKAVAGKTPAANATAEALATAKSTANEVKKRFDVARAKLRELETQLMPANSQYRVATVRKILLDGQISTAELAVDYAKLSAMQATVEAELQKRAAEFEIARQTLQANEAVLAKLKKELDATKQAAESMTAAHATMAKQYATRQEISTLTAEATAGATLAASKLPNDTELKTTLTSLSKRGSELKTEVAALQKAVAEKQQEAASAVERMQVAQSTTDAKAKEFAALQATVAPLEKAHGELRAKVAAGRSELNQLTNSLIKRWEAHFYTNRLDHLSPEELAWSMMQATDFLQGQIAAANADADKTLPIDPQNPNEPKRLAEREKHVEAFVYEKVKGQLAAFVKLFGHAAGQPQADFFATVDQALFFSNGGTVLSWLNPSGNNLTARLNKLQEPQAIAEEVYISVLTRRPDEQETNDVVAYLASRKDDKVGALKEMAWALVTSAEFRFSH